MKDKFFIEKKVKIDLDIKKKRKENSFKEKLIMRKEKMNWKIFKGKRILINDIFDIIEEVKVEEVSPSGKYAKLIYLKDNTVRWVKEKKVLEVLD